MNSMAYSTLQDHGKSRDAACPCLAVGHTDKLWFNQPFSKATLQQQRAGILKCLEQSYSRYRSLHFKLGLSDDHRGALKKI